MGEHHNQPRPFLPKPGPAAVDRMKPSISFTTQSLIFRERPRWPTPDPCLCLVPTALRPSLGNVLRACQATTDRHLQHRPNWLPCYSFPRVHDNVPFAFPQWAEEPHLWLAAQPKDATELSSNAHNLFPQLMAEAPLNEAVPALNIDTTMHKGALISSIVVL